MKSPQHYIRYILQAILRLLLMIPALYMMVIVSVVSGVGLFCLWVFKDLMYTPNYLNWMDDLEEFFFLYLTITLWTVGITLNPSLLEKGVGGYYGRH